MLDRHGLGKNDDENDFADLGGLDHDRQAEIEPALVAAALNAEKAEHGDEQHAEQQQQLAPLGDDVHVDERKEHIQRDAEQQCNELDQHIAAVARVICRAGDDDDAIDRCRDTERQEQHVRFFDKFADGAEDTLHRNASFRKCPAPVQFRHTGGAVSTL